jgi:general secretion pathway protein F
LLGASLQSQLIIARNKISNGEPFTQAMTNAGLTTPVAEQLMRVGEKSASLDNMLERAASFHEQEMIRWIDAFSKIFEPVLMAVIGIIIGGIVLLMYLPIFELASGIQ